MQYLVPVDGLDEFFDFCSRIASCVNSANEAAHAGSSNVVDRDPVFFKPLYDTDVRQTQRPAAFEHSPTLGRGGVAGWENPETNEAMTKRLMRLTL